MRILSAFAVAAFATSAFAADKVEAPKPSAMLEAAFKDAPGNWTCKGTWSEPNGSSMTVTTKAKFAKTLGGHQYTAEFTMPKSATMPGMKTFSEWHYDPITKGLVSTMVSDNGDASRATSTGMNGQTIIWNMEGTMMGQPTKMRMTQTTKGPKEVAMIYEVEANGSWMKIGDESCKK